MRHATKLLFLLLAFLTLAGISGVTPSSKTKPIKKAKAKKPERKSFSEREIILVKILSQTKIKELL